MATPGHTANHMAFALKDKNLLFAGDHVMAWATSIVAPPDGAMSDYMASLGKLAKRGETIYLPGHGPAINDAPRFVNYYILHRKAREASILHRLPRARPISRPSCARSISASIRASPAPPACRCWRIWRIWWRAGWSRPKGRLRFDGVYRLWPLGR